MRKTKFDDALFRFVLSFDGEGQGVGLLNGIYSTDIPEERAKELSGRFDDLLPVARPHARSVQTVMPEFWFTYKGLLTFRDDLWQMVKALPPPWGAEGAMIRRGRLVMRAASQTAVLYEDEYQVALVGHVREQFCPVEFSYGKCRGYLRDKRFLPDGRDPRPSA